MTRAIVKNYSNCTVQSPILSFTEKQKLKRIIKYDIFHLLNKPYTKIVISETRLFDIENFNRTQLTFSFLVISGFRSLLIGWSVESSQVVLQSQLPPE